MTFFGKYGGTREAAENMALARGMLNEQSYKHADHTDARKPMHSPTRARTRTEMYNTYSSSTTTVVS
jgi:hypothetical protein